MKDKLELVIEDISRRQIEGFRKKSADHLPGTEHDVASDNYDWDNDSLDYWRNEVAKHFEKWWDASDITHGEKHQSLDAEKKAIFNLMNVLVCRLHKLELLEGVE